MGLAGLAKVAKKAISHIEDLKDGSLKVHYDLFSMDFMAVNAMGFRALVNELRSAQKDPVAHSTLGGNDDAEESISYDSTTDATRAPTPHPQQNAAESKYKSLLEQMDDILLRDNPRKIYVHKQELTSNKTRARNVRKTTQVELRSISLNHMLIYLCIFFS